MATQKSKYAFDRNYYVNNAKNSAYNGNAARKLSVVPDEEYEEDFDELFENAEAEYAESIAEPAMPSTERRSRRKNQHLAEPKQKVKYQVKFNFFPAVVFTIAIAALMFSAFRLLNVQSAINDMDKQISSAEFKLSDVQALNASLSLELDTEIDRNYIYSVAVGKLGMVYPDKNQVVYYESSSDGYVIQMSAIPQN